MNQKSARILLLCDEVDPAYYRYWKPERFDGIDLIISCGDLPARYLEYVATLFHGDVLYVPGNHDERYLHHEPEGCINIDGRIFTWRGIRILGLGGSMRYKPGPYQYTQKEMNRRIRKLWFRLHRSNGFDILVTHSPAYGISDGKDLCHTGFQAFLDLIEKYHPKYFFHGHVHMNYGNYPRTYKIDDTIAVNAYTSYIIDVRLPQSL